MDGESLVPFLTDPETQGREHFLLEFWRYFPESTPSYTGVRTGRYKYVEYERGRDPCYLTCKTIRESTPISMTPPQESRSSRR